MRDKVHMWILAVAMVFSMVMVNALIATAAFVNLLIAFGLLMYYRQIFLYG